MSSFFGAFFAKYSLCDDFLWLAGDWFGVLHCGLAVKVWPEGHSGKLVGSPDPLRLGNEQIDTNRFLGFCESKVFVSVSRLGSLMIVFNFCFCRLPPEKQKKNVSFAE